MAENKLKRLSTEELAARYIITTDGRVPMNVDNDVYIDAFPYLKEMMGKGLTNKQIDDHLMRAREAYFLLHPEGGL